MADYRNATEVRVSPAALFDYLSRVENLPRYFARMRSAELVDAGGGGGAAGRRAVRTTAELPDGQVVEGEAWLEVDSDALTMRWGSEGPGDYHGELSVTAADGSGEGARVHVVISTERVESDEVQQGVDRTVAAIKDEVEARSPRPAS